MRIQQLLGIGVAALILYLAPSIPSIYPDSLAVDFLVEQGEAAFKQQYYSEAEDSFQKALLVSPRNEKALAYLQRIKKRGQSTVVPVVVRSVSPAALTAASDQRTPSSSLKAQENTVTFEDVRRYKMTEVLNTYEIAVKRPGLSQDRTISSASPEIPPQGPLLSMHESEAYKDNTARAEALMGPPTERISMHGELDMGIAIEEERVYWNQSNPLMQSIFGNKPWQYLWGPRRFNSYDPDVYSRLSLDLDARREDPRFSSHMNIVIDPYSFIGIAEVDAYRVRSRAADGSYTPHVPSADVAHVVLKYFPATNQTIDEIYRSESGNILTVPPIKVRRLTDTTVSWASGASETWGALDPHIGEFYVGPAELDYKYRIIREWFYDYKDETTFVRIFPFAYEDQAYFSDDPLRLSGNKMFWEENPWLDYFEPSVAFNRPGSPIKKASWVRKYSFLSKDMDLRNMTLLRGMRAGFDDAGVRADLVVAAPLNIWEDYDNVNTINQAFRLKAGEDTYLGGLFTSKLGLYKGSIEGRNLVGGLDGAYAFNDHVRLLFEGAYSYTAFDHALGVREHFDGIGVCAALELRKTLSVYAAYLEDSFYPGLSSYRYTRDDAFYGKYLLFDDLSGEEEAFKLGDAIERGRLIQGLTYQTDFFRRLARVRLDIRNAYDHTGNEWKETVYRLDTAWQPVKKLTLRSLVWYQALPQTRQGEDPLITADRAYTLTDYFSLVHEPLQNMSIPAGEDPSIGWFGVGGKYDLFDSCSLIGIYQRTNDPRDYPRTLLTDTYYQDTWEDGVLYDAVVPFLYDQSFFGLPPYEYYDIYKAKMLLRVGKASVTFSFTKNQNKYDVGIDDNVNHIGLRLRYPVNKKVTVTSEYTYTRFIDLYEQVMNGVVRYDGHHNFFAGLRYAFDADQFLDVLFGQLYAYVSGSSLWALGPADTVHMVRLRYSLHF